MHKVLNIDNIRSVVVDLDGTLYNKHFMAMRMALSDFRHAKLMLAERKVRKQLAGQYFGNEDNVYATLYQLIAEKVGKTELEVKNWYENTYMPTMVGVIAKYYPLTDFARNLINDCNEKNIPVIVFSDYGCVREKLQALGLSPQQFAHIYAAPQLGGFKPSKEVFAKLLQTLNLKAEETLMVGDRIDTDGIGAQSVGMPFYQVKY